MLCNQKQKQSKANPPTTTTKRSNQPTAIKTTNLRSKREVETNQIDRKKPTTKIGMIANLSLRSPKKLKTAPFSVSLKAAQNNQTQTTTFLSLSLSLSFSISKLQPPPAAFSLNFV